MTATLNQDDIKLLKSVFPTKEDLKAEIEGLESKMNARFDELEPIIAKSFEDLEHRVRKLENVAGIPVIQ